MAGEDAIEATVLASQRWHWRHRRYGSAVRHTEVGAMRPYALLIIGAVLLLCSCSPPLQVAAPLAEEDQIRETVFRYLFEFNVSGQGKMANAYYLRVEGHADPTSQLLQRFTGHKPVVKPASAATLEPGTALVVDRETGKPGLIFWIGEIRWQSDDSVEVDGGYEEASESASGNTYHLSRAGGKWEVVEVEGGYIK
jgi:hypothetical protein